MARKPVTEGTPEAPRARRSTGRGRGAPPASDPALEAAIDAAPDDAAGYFAYAAWLKTQGDPRGRWIEAHHQLELDPTDQELADEIQALAHLHRAALLPARDIAASDTRWWKGFVRVARVARKSSKDPFPRRLEALLAHPSARFLRGLVLTQTQTFSRHNPGVYEIKIDLEPALSMLERSPPTLTALAIGEPLLVSHIYQKHFSMPTAHRIWSALPQLRTLVLDAIDLDLGRIDAPRLQRLEIRGDGVDEATLAAVIDAPLPALRHLHLRLGSARADDFTRLSCSTLEHLSLSGGRAGLQPTVLAALLAWRGLSSLRTLQIDEPSVTTLQHLTEQADAFAHLEEVRIAPSKFGELAQLAMAMPNLRELDPVANLAVVDAVEALDRWLGRGE